MLSTVLVVDGDRSVSRAVEVILQRADYQVITATHGEQAARFAAQRQVDLVMVGRPTDSVPLALVSRIRAIQPSSLRVLITHDEPDTVVRDAFRRGDVLRLLKAPIHEAAVLDLIKEAWAFSRKMALFTASQMQSVRRLEAQMLESCFQDGLLSVSMQPVFAVKQSSAPSEPVAYEALLRSNHPILNSPRAVLKVAEARGKVPQLGKLVFAMVSRWAGRMPSEARIFVNVHPDQLADAARFRDDIMPLMWLSNRLVMEIDESSGLDFETGEPRKCVDLMKSRGFQIAIDDVGMGDNHLGLLADLSPAFLKLPMHLIRDVDNDPRKQKMVSLITRMAGATGMRLVAKGVETTAEVDSLKGLGLTWMMGYHFGRPQPMTESPAPRRRAPEEAVEV